MTEELLIFTILVCTEVNIIPYSMLRGVLAIHHP
jgi:hypothetical protein